MNLHKDLCAIFDTIFYPTEGADFNNPDGHQNYIEEIHVSPRTWHEIEWGSMGEKPPEQVPFDCLPDGKCQLRGITRIVIDRTVPDFEFRIKLHRNPTAVLDRQRETSD